MLKHVADAYGEEGAKYKFRQNAEKEVIVMSDNSFKDGINGDVSYNYRKLLHYIVI